jgi:hypothetical protein
MISKNFFSFFLFLSFNLFLLTCFINFNPPSIYPSIQYNNSIFVLLIDILFMKDEEEEQVMMSRLWQSFVYKYFLSLWIDEEKKEGKMKYYMKDMTTRMTTFFVFIYIFIFLPPFSLCFSSFLMLSCINKLEKI